MNTIEFFVKATTITLGAVVEGFASLLVAHAALRAGYAWLRSVGKKPVNKSSIRFTLGKSLALSLEFFLAADILRTAVSPTWDEIGKLVAVAALRTALNFFLEKELTKANKISSSHENLDNIHSLSA